MFQFYCFLNKIVSSRVYHSISKYPLLSICKTNLLCLVDICLFLWPIYGFLKLLFLVPVINHLPYNIKVMSTKHCLVLFVRNKEALCMGTSSHVIRMYVPILVSGRNYAVEMLAILFLFSSAWYYNASELPFVLNISCHRIVLKVYLLQA